VDSTLTTAATAGTRALKSGSAKKGDQALAISGRELSRRMACQGYLEMIDRYQLSEILLFQGADIRTLGIGTTPIKSAIGPALGVIFIGDAGAGKVTTCN
jgi:hypothetical protein